jgi:microsomal epoxide hydrolase
MRPKSAAATALLIAILGAIPAWTAEPAPVEDGFLTMPDGVKIHYLEAGQGPPIVLIPGWTIAADIWEAQIAYLSQSHRVVAFDPRGQGRSDKPAEGSYPAARARDLEAVLDQLHLAPATLVCWSLAVGECVAYVDQFGTGKISALVLVDGLQASGYDAERTPALLRFVGQFQQDRRAMTESFVRSMYKKPRSEEYLRRVIDGALLTPTDTAVALFVGTVNRDDTAALAKIDKPTLIAVTESPFLDAYRKLQKRIPKSRMEVFQAGHALFVDEPEKFNKMVEELVDSLAPEGPHK